MAGTSENVRIWDTIDFYAGPEGTTMPDAAALADPSAEAVAAALDPALEPVGYVDQEDAVSRERTSEDKDHYALGNVLVRRTSSKPKTQLSFTALENTDLVFNLANPGSESESAGGVTTRTVRPKNLGQAIRAVVVVKRDGDIVELECIPRAQITSSGTSQESDSDMDGEPLTLDYLASTDEGGRTFYSTEITNDPAAEVSAS